MATAGTEDQVEPASAGMDKQKEKGTDSSSIVQDFKTIKFHCEMFRIRNDKNDITFQMTGVPHHYQRSSKDDDGRKAGNHFNIRY